MLDDELISRLAGRRRRDRFTDAACPISVASIFLPFSLPGLSAIDSSYILDRFVALIEADERLAVAVVDVPALRKELAIHGEDVDGVRVAMGTGRYLRDVSPMKS